mmetsp:Transcript_58890/g.175215  ORF Transcript_58890/g.175215 Transcript_58890/m.175215 type:complete len:230 (+) Transcript_58890:111-800(+)
MGNPCQGPPSTVGGIRSRSQMRPLLRINVADSTVTYAATLSNFRHHLLSLLAAYTRVPELLAISLARPLPPRGYLSLTRPGHLAVPNPKTFSLSTSPTFILSFPKMETSFSCSDMRPSNKIGKLTRTHSSAPIGNFPTCISTCSQHALAGLPAAAHPAAPLLAHINAHKIPVTINTHSAPCNTCQDLPYGCHGSTMHKANFVRTKLTKQALCRYIIVLPLSLICHLPGL